MPTGHGRRTFLKSAAALAATGAVPAFPAAAEFPGLAVAPRPKKNGVVRGAFFYPPEQVVYDGKLEDNWAKHKWFTWPGNQFQPKQQQAKFMAHLREMTQPLDVDLRMDEAPIYTDAGFEAFAREAAESEPEALLLINFWNSFSGKLNTILDAYEGPIILYHVVGANHQLPPERFRTEKRMQYIHGVEAWEALERGLRAVHAKVRMRQSRMLRVSGRLDKEADAHEAFFDMPIHGIPATQYNELFDAIEVTDDMRRMAREVRGQARKITDLEEKAFVDACRAHATVLELLERHDADAITTDCLFLKHRKPCLSFALNNDVCVPCGCENDLNATLTLMLGANLFGRGGFEHNPEFDLEENRYFASHCTCATRLQGPDKAAAPFDLRPFFHQMPKTLALDVIWPEGERCTLCKFHSGDNRLDAWAGTIVSSPACPPTGGCATRVLTTIDGVDDVCDVYPGPHPILYCGDFARQMKTFAKLYDLELRTNG